MPGLVDRFDDILEDVVLHSKIGLRDVAFQHGQSFKAGVVPRVGFRHERQHIENAVSGRRCPRAACKGRYAMTVFQKAICEVTSNESRRTSDENVFRRGHSEVESSRSIPGPNC